MTATCSAAVEPRLGCWDASSRLLIFIIPRPESRKPDWARWRSKVNARSYIGVRVVPMQTEFTRMP